MPFWLKGVNQSKKLCKTYPFAVLVQVFSFSFHTQRGQLTDCARIARNKKRLAPRLARSIRLQPLINRAPAGHYQPFKHPTPCKASNITCKSLDDGATHFLVQGLFMNPPTPS